MKIMRYQSQIRLFLPSIRNQKHTNQVESQKVPFQVLQLEERYTLNRRRRYSKYSTQKYLKEEGSTTYIKNDNT